MVIIPWARHACVPDTCYRIACTFIYNQNYGCFIYFHSIFYQSCAFNLGKSQSMHENTYWTIRSCQQNQSGLKKEQKAYLKHSLPRRYLMEKGIDILANLTNLSFYLVCSIGQLRAFLTNSTIVTLFFTRKVTATGIIILLYHTLILF